MVARRDRHTNVASIGYEKIEEYTHIKRVRIKTAISFLAARSLVYVERLPSTVSPDGVANSYRVVGVEPAGTWERRGERWIASISLRRESEFYAYLPNLFCACARNLPIMVFSPPCAVVAKMVTKSRKSRMARP